MFLLVSLIICHGLLLYITTTSAKHCDPSNHICSGRCPDLPPKLDLPFGVAICMKDTKTKACICWLDSDTSHPGSLFICEAQIDGSINQIYCYAPSNCFPKDTEPTCLIIPFCDCVPMNDESSSVLEFGHWRPVKAIIKLNQSSELSLMKSEKKYTSQIQEFSLKHLLFLLGFVIAPLLCWCLLNFVTEKKWKCKNVSCTEAQPVNIDRSTMTTNISPPSDNEALLNNSINDTQTSSFQNEHSNIGNLDSNQTSSELLQKIEHPPPSYDEAVHGNFFQENDDTPPPPYEDCICVRNSGQPWSSLACTHSRSYENM